MIYANRLKTLALPLVIFFFYACQSNSGSKQKTDDIGSYREEQSQDQIARGAYIVSTSACNDCHSPKILTPQGPIVDTTKILSGHPATNPLPPFDAAALQPGNWIQMAPDLTAFVGPWGISYSANLTSDSATGIGAWNEDVFIKTIRTGKHLGQENGRMILPPMPWPEISKMKDEDLKAVFAYLNSRPPIHNRLPQPLSPPEAMKLAKK
jgi:hypothetical protein